ncbi:MAG TPA: GDP-mannose 4,6-dehydratase [Anaerolineae bacterium]|nr:GDP-mannose 4,6-dehydratase [Anaerolineae bacterium]HOQ98398.1 GDP-mannose 4,6-dehydratase [Anaerolineae bacterium]HPL26490.1 GDP-mannose 4,6-dehydratase [Anaerolineae bacterium]
MAHYLVTGVAGFIASQVAGLLLAEGHTVVGVDNLNDAYDVRLKQWRLAQLEGRPGFTFQKLDICDRSALAELFRVTHHASRITDQVLRVPFDAVVDLAARAGVRQSVENPWVYVETNVTGTLNLLELCREHGVGKFVLASTSSLYGKDNPMPYREDANTDHPLSPYAASKKAAEALCYTYHYLYGIDITIPRYFTVYGPAGRPDMSLFRFVQWIAEGRPVIVYGDGTQSRDFSYVDDIARGTVAALKPVGFEVVNLGSDRPVVLNEAIRLVEDLLGKKAQIEQRPGHPADVPATWADIGKAERLLGWRPHCAFADGVGCLVQWYQENREWAREVSAW